jgi:hypothetical protein
MIASFQSDQGWCPVRKLLWEHRSLDPLADDFASRHVDPVQLKYGLCNIRANGRIFHDGPSDLPVKIL